MTRIQVRRGTAAQWVASTTPLNEGEIGFETDTGKYKIGRRVSLPDGALIAWNSLGYAASGANAVLGNALTISGGLVFNSGSTFDGSAAREISIAATIAANTTGNAATSSTLATPRTINGASFNGSANVIVGGAVYGTTATAASTFKNIYVSQSTPSAPTNGDVWISW
jgi:hypothetical protein